MDGLHRQVVGVEDTAHTAQSIGQEVLPVAGSLLLAEGAVAVFDETGGVRAGGAGEDVVESRLHVEEIGGRDAVDTLLHALPQSVVLNNQ